MRAPRQHCDDAVELMPALTGWLSDEPWPAAESLDALAALNYTGGTTGLPKGCMHTQRDMLYTAAANCGVAIQNAPETVFLSFFLQSWIAGENGGLIFHVFCGKPLVLLSRWDPVTVLQAVAHYRVTSMVMTVDSALELLDHPQFQAHDLRSLRQPRVVSFMKKLSLGDRVRWRERQGSNLVESAWGMTETHTSDTFTTGLQQDDFDLKSTPVFIGLPVPGTEFRICDFESRAVLPLGASGELCIRTPSLFKGYWRQPLASAAVLSGDWFHTGDIGVVDRDVFLHYLGRRKEMIKVKGLSVFPMAMETVLGRHELVLGSGVVALADERYGELPVAFVQLRPECAVPDVAQLLRAWCDACMASYKVPQLRLVERLPVTATGKVDKKVLLQWLAAQASAPPT
jgi:fatty-acyl-CoA synthase